jgi:hypothetical protein
MAMGEVNIVRQNGWLAQERFIWRPEPAICRPKGFE